jgi:DNA end-binding protein Ku
MSGREYLVAVGALDQGLAMYILRYANEVRPADAYFSGIPDMKVNPELVDLATRLIAEGTTEFNPQQFRNTYEVRLNELVQQKAKGRKVVVKTEEEDRPKGANVVDLMDALRKSIKGDKSGDKPPPVKKGGRKK